MGVRLLALLEVDYIIQQENEEIQQSIAKFPMIGSSLQKKYVYLQPKRINNNDYDCNRTT